MDWVVRYARHYAHYEDVFDSEKEAVSFAAYLSEYGEGYVKGVYNEDGKLHKSLDEIWDVINEKN